jgi:hypothetical protein
MCRSDLASGIRRRHESAARAGKGEVNLHDGALFYDADQHDQTHKRVDVQVDLKQQQREQRAKARYERDFQLCIWAV